MNFINKLSTSATTVVTTVDTAFTALDNASSVLRTYSTEWAQRAQHEAEAHSKQRHDEFLVRCDERALELARTYKRMTEDPQHKELMAIAKKLRERGDKSRKQFLAKQEQNHLTIAAE